MQSLVSLAEHIPAIIEAAAKSTLGVLSLLSLLVALIALRFFARAAEWMRFAVFSLILLSVAAFGFVAVNVAEQQFEDSKKTSEEDIELRTSSWYGDFLSSSPMVAALVKNVSDRTIVDIKLQIDALARFAHHLDGTAPETAEVTALCLGPISNSDVSVEFERDGDHPLSYRIHSLSPGQFLYLVWPVYSHNANVKALLTGDPLLDRFIRPAHREQISKSDGRDLFPVNPGSVNVSPDIVMKARVEFDGHIKEEENNGLIPDQAPFYGVGGGPAFTHYRALYRATLKEEVDAGVETILDAGAAIASLCHYKP